VQASFDNSALVNSTTFELPALAFRQAAQTALVDMSHISARPHVDKSLRYDEITSWQQGHRVASLERHSALAQHDRTSLSLVS
jgi:hypothetical protein